MPCVKGTVTPNPKKQIILSVVWFNPALTSISGVSGAATITPKKGNAGISEPVKGLVDTGAAMSCITRNVAQSIKSALDGQVLVAGVHGSEVAPIYTVGLFIPQISFLVPELKVVEMAGVLGDANSILGMDILLRGYLQLDSQGHFKFCV